MRHAVVVSVVALALIALAPAPVAAGVSVGTNLGVTIHHPSDGGDDVTLVGVPTQSNAFSSMRPGLRVGYAGVKRDHEVYADVSYDSQSDGDFSVHAMRLAANYQFNFSAGASARPYLTAGLGLYNVGGDSGFGSSVGATSTTYGAGVGLGVPLSQDHGRFRFEFRVDRLTEGKDSGDIVIGEATLYQFVAGFDLWMN